MCNMKNIMGVCIYRSPEFVGAEGRGGRELSSEAADRYRLPDGRSLKRLYEGGLGSPPILVALRVRKIP